MKTFLLSHWQSLHAKFPTRTLLGSLQQEPRRTEAVGGQDIRTSRNRCLVSPSLCRCCLWYSSEEVRFGRAAQVPSCAAGSPGQVLRSSSMRAPVTTDAASFPSGRCLTSDVDTSQLATQVVRKGVEALFESRIKFNKALEMGQPLQPDSWAPPKETGKRGVDEFNKLRSSANHLATSSNAIIERTSDENALRFPIRSNQQFTEQIQWLSPSPMRQRATACSLQTLQTATSNTSLRNADEEPLDVAAKGARTSAVEASLAVHDAPNPRPKPTVSPLSDAAQFATNSQYILDGSIECDRKSLPDGHAVPQTNDYIWVSGHAPDCELPRITNRADDDNTSSSNRDSNSVQSEHSKVIAQPPHTTEKAESGVGVKNVSGLHGGGVTIRIAPTLSVHDSEVEIAGPTGNCQPADFQQEEIKRPDPRGAAKISMHYQLLGSAELRALPPIEWRIQGILPEQGIACIFGRSTAGKSFLALDVAAAIAEGATWFGYRVKRSPVVYVCLEGSAGFRQRAMAWEAHNKRALPPNLRVVLQPFSLTDSKSIRAMATSVLTLGKGVVTFIDTLNASTPGLDENSPRDMGLIIEGAKNLQTITGGLITLISHTGKDATKGLRGHSSLFAALDCAVEVSRVGKRREWEVVKSKDGADGDLRRFVLEVVELGLGCDDEPVSSCIVRQEDSGEFKERENRPKGANQTLALNVLREMLDSSETFGKGEAPLHVSCVELDRAIQHIASRMDCDPARRKERTKSSLDALVSGGFVMLSDGWLWKI